MRRTLVLVLLLLHATLGARAAYACSCAGRTLREGVAEAETVFAGEVVEARGDRYEVRVHGVLKGRLPPTVTVHAESANSCSIDLPLGPIFYAAGRDLYAAGCMTVYTGAYASQVAATYHMDPPDPSAPDPGRSRKGPIALALLALGVAAFGYRRSARQAATAAAGSNY